MKVGELCRAVEQRTGMRCTPAMVRNYEKRGMIPGPERTAGNTRIYSEAHTETVARILELRSRFLRLDAIKIALAGGGAGATGCREKEIAEAVASGRRRRKQDRRSHIIEAATRCFSEKGYHHTTMQDVADFAGCGVGTLYSYFEGKKVLLLAVADDVMRQMLERVAGVDAEEPDPIRRLKAKGLTFLETYGQVKDIIFILQAETVSDDAEFVNKVDELFHEYTEATRDDLRAATASGCIRDVDVEIGSYALLGFVQLLGYRLGRDHRYKPADIIEFASDIFLNGVAPKEPAPKAQAPKESGP